MPATKAPSASESPACSVIQASPSVMSSRLSMNSSSLLRMATCLSHQRSHFWPHVSSRPSSNTALTRASPSAVASSSGGDPRAGISTSRGTTAKSWNSSTPTTRLPWSESSSSRSATSLMTMAVLLIAITPPSARAVRQSIFHQLGKNQSITSEPSVASTMVATT